MTHGAGSSASSARRSNSFGVSATSSPSTSRGACGGRSSSAPTRSRAGSSLGPRPPVRARRPRGCGRRARGSRTASRGSRRRRARAADTRSISSPRAVSTMMRARRSSRRSSGTTSAPSTSGRPRSSSTRSASAAAFNVPHRRSGALTSKPSRSSPSTRGAAIASRPRPAALERGRSFGGSRLRTVRADGSALPGMFAPSAVAGKKRSRRRTGGTGVEGRVGVGPQRLIRILSSAGSGAHGGPATCSDPPGNDPILARMAPMRITFLGHAGCFVETRAGSVLCDPWFTPAYFGSWFPFPAQRPARSGGVRRARLPLRLAPAPRPLRSGVARPPRATSGRRCCSPSSASAVARAGAAVARVHRVRAHARTASGSTSTASTVTVLAMTSPADGPLGDSAIVLDDGTARRPQPERRPARRSRRAPRARPIRRAAAAVLGCDLVPDRLRLPARGEGTARARTSASTRWRAPGTTSRRSDAAHVFPCAGPPCFLDDDALRVQRPRPRSRPTSFPTRPCSSTSSRRTASTAPI